LYCLYAFLFESILGWSVGEAVATLVFCQAVNLMIFWGVFPSLTFAYFD